MRERTTGPPKRAEFSKLIMAAVMATYFCGVIIGGAVVAHAPEQLGAYLSYLGAATTVSIGFYAWKAKAENVIKLNQGGRKPRIGTDAPENE